MTPTFSLLNKSFCLGEEYKFGEKEIREVFCISVVLVAVILYIKSFFLYLGSCFAMRERNEEIDVAYQKSADFCAW